MPPPAEVFGVAGRPIAHSLSPEIFRRLFRATGMNAFYVRLAADSAGGALETARAIGLRGLNMTSPFKEAVVSCLDRLDDQAARIGAVNCVTFGPPRGRSGPWGGGAGCRPRSKIGADVRDHHGSGTVGHNTDSLGLIGSLQAMGLPPQGKTVLVLGTGGAARAAVYGLRSRGAAKVVVAGRSVEKAMVLARALGCLGASLDDVKELLGEADLCVSCLPFPASRVLGGSAQGLVPVVDAHYAPGARSTAAAAGFPSAALSWLVYQAVPAFELFTGRDVPRDIAQVIWEDIAGLERPRKPHIAFVGFMGAGKTAVGRVFAELTGMEFFDTDEMIEAETGMPIPRIFERRGEGAFRALEKSVIGKLADASDASRKVISIGGGAILEADNLMALARISRIVWLWAPAAACLSRIDAATRPVLDPERPLPSAQRILAARMLFYASASDLVINAATASPREVALRVKDEMDQAFGD